MARSGSRSSASTGRGASCQAEHAFTPAAAACADRVAANRSGTTGPATTGPAANGPISDLATASGLSLPPAITTSRSPSTPVSTCSLACRAARRMASTVSSLSPSGAVPSTTHTCSGEFQPRAAARDTAPSSASPLSTALTTSDSSRASQAPRASAAWA